MEAQEKLIRMQRDNPKMYEDYNKCLASGVQMKNWVADVYEAASDINPYEYTGEDLEIFIKKFNLV